MGLISDPWRLAQKYRQWPNYLFHKIVSNDHTLYLVVCRTVLRRKMSHSYNCGKQNTDVIILEQLNR